METPPKRLKVLLSAYACEPNRGSEPGVGWEWANRLAEFHDVTVLTRANNRDLIEAFYQTSSNTPRPEFLFVDLSAMVIRLKKLGLVPVFIYYLFWQLVARRAAMRENVHFDIIHHVTFNGFRFPGAWWQRKEPIVLGPLGGGSIAARDYRPCFGSRWILEKVRELSIVHWQWNPWTAASLRNATKVLVVGQELQSRFSHYGVQAEMMLETALPQGLEGVQPEIAASDKKDFIWVGNLEPWKAWQIALQAYALAVSDGLGDNRLKIVGCGSQAAAALESARNLGIADRVDFLGSVPRDEVWDLMTNARALVFSSVRDTSGNVVLEAMGMSCPVICFKHQGVAMITDDSCAIRVTPGSWESSVSDFRTAILALASNDKLVDLMGRNARSRVFRELTWSKKVTRMLEIYAESLRRSR